MSEGGARALAAVLCQSRARLLSSSDLQKKCRLAARARGVCAVSCVGGFVFMLVMVAGWQAVSLRLLPGLLAAGFLLFLLSAMLASRFGRLCSAELGSSEQRAIAHFRAHSPRCERYYQSVKAQERPFTRLDLAEMRHLSRAAGRT